MVTGSCYLLETSQHKILIDCGLYQGNKETKERNYHSFPFNPGEISHCLLTHAHTDHSGLIPKLFKDGYSGKVTTTQATMELCKIMLPDSGHIQEMEVERKNRKRARAGLSPLNPIYTADEAAECLKNFKGVEYNEVIQLYPEVQIRFKDAGHILGSANIEVWVTEGNQQNKLVFSGDIGNTHQPYIEDPSCLEAADYVIMESTYGNRLHETGVDKLDILKEVINDTFQRGGNVIIPAFAVERTQDILYYLSELFENSEIAPADIYIDSPLAIAATEVFRHNLRYFDRETQDMIKGGDDPLNMPRLHFSQTANDSRALNEIKGRSIIIAASGMADAGRIKHHLRHNLWRPESTILFVGYQAEGTLGRRLVNGEKRVMIHGEEVAVRAKIVSIDGFSAHADQAGLLNWVRCFGGPVKGIILIHGEPSAQAELAGKIKEITGLDPLIPGLGETFEWSEAGLKRIPPDPSQVKVEAPKEEVPLRRYEPEQVTKAQLNKAVQQLHRRVKELVETGSREKDLYRLKRSIQEITEVVESKLRQRQER